MSGWRRGASELGPRRSDVASGPHRGCPDNDGTCSGRASSAAAMRHDGEAAAPYQHRRVFFGSKCQTCGPTGSVDRHRDRRISQGGRDGVRGAWGGQPGREQRGGAAGLGVGQVPLSEINFSVGSSFVCSQPHLLSLTKVHYLLAGLFRPLRCPRGTVRRGLFRLVQPSTESQLSDRALFEDDLQKWPQRGPITQAYM